MRLLSMCIVVCFAWVGLALGDATPAEAKRYCKGDHLHYGSSNDDAVSKKQALIQAQRTWSSFTIMEYGRSWGSFRRAVNKRVDCSPVEDSKRWRCEVEATPCRS